jgi:ribosomal protein L11 methyltransferase
MVPCVHLVRVVVEPGAEADAAAGALWLHGPAAVEERQSAEGRIELVAGFADEAAAERVAAALRWPAATEPAPDEATWRDAWRAHARPVVVGRVAVVPSWLPAPDAAVVVRVDPGTAFGTGSHPSTRLVLAALQGLVRPGCSVLDAGSGTGVLAVAARLLGAGRVVAFDVASEAVVATAANAALNEVEVDTRHATIDEIGGTFDVVLANIGAATLTAMAPALAARVGDSLVLAGLLDGQVPEVVAAYARRGLDLVRAPSEDGWSAPLLRRTG